MLTDNNYTTTPLARFQVPSLAIGAIALVASIAGYFLLPADHKSQFFQSYLFAFIIIFTLTMGSLALLCIQYLSGGVWGILLRRNLEASVKNLPLVFLMFLPIGFGIGQIYEWSPNHHHYNASDKIIQMKAPYLNETMFWGQSIVFFLVWIVLGLSIVRYARRYEDEGSPWTALRIRQLSAGTLVFLGLSLTLASVHWLMSLEPHWFSTMYGISFLVACLLLGHAFNVIVLVANSREGHLPKLWNRVHFRDLGNLLLAFVMLWAYTAFCQWLLIWYGNLREEIPWYIRRAQGEWLYIGAALLIFHFFVPFFMLLNRPLKENPRWLAAIAAFLIFMRLVDFFWIIMPAWYPEGFHIHWLDVTTLVALFALWIGFYIRNLRRRPLVPTYEPYVQEALSHG